jgi:thioredoxin reductase (NADPH)
MTDVIVIGGGPAGLTAALYAARYGLQVTVLEKNIYGGQIALSGQIENYPGLGRVLGADLANSMYKQVADTGCKFIFEEVLEANLSGENKFVKTSVRELSAKTVVIAIGLQRRKLDVEGEKKFVGKGVSYCATCDGAFFKHKKVAVIGGGNVALQDAIYLSRICKKVYIIVRKSFLRADRYLINTIKNLGNVTVLTESRVLKILGIANFEQKEKCTTENKMQTDIHTPFANSNPDKVNGIVILNAQRETKLDVSGVFIAIGYEPSKFSFGTQLDKDKNGYIISDELCRTNIQGVYVAGDCRDKQLRQIVTAAADGAIAGNQANKFISATVFRK